MCLVTHRLNWQSPGNFAVLIFRLKWMAVTQVNHLVNSMSGTGTLLLAECIFRIQTQWAGIYFIESMLLCCLGRPACLNNAMENNGVLNWAYDRAIVPFVHSSADMFEACYQAACLHTEDEGLFFNNYCSFPWETGAHDDIQLSCSSLSTRKVRSRKQVNKTCLRLKD